MSYEITAAVLKLFNTIEEVIFASDGEWENTDEELFIESAGIVCREMKEQINHFMSKLRKEEGDNGG